MPGQYPAILNKQAWSAIFTNHILAEEPLHLDQNHTSKQRYAFRLCFLTKYLFENRDLLSPKALRPTLRPTILLQMDGIHCLSCSDKTSFSIMSSQDLFGVVDVCSPTTFQFQNPFYRKIPYQVNTEDWQSSLIKIGQSGWSTFSHLFFQPGRTRGDLCHRYLKLSSSCQHYLTLRNSVNTIEIQ